MREFFRRISEQARSPLRWLAASRTAQGEAPTQAPLEEGQTPAGDIVHKFYAASCDGPLRQSELISSLTQIRAISSSSAGAVQVERVQHPLAVVLSQDCDLEQDFRARKNPPATGPSDDKLLPSIIFCQVETADELRGRNAIDSKTWKKVRANKDERYQYLSAVPASDDRHGAGLPELGLDFKRYFTLPTEDVYLQLRRGEASRRCFFLSPYLEQLSTRFCYYQFRVALPKDH